MMEENPELIWTSRDRDGYTPVYWVASRGHIKLLKRMYELTVATSTEDKRNRRLKNAFEIGSRYGKTPAHIAARSGHIHCLEFLITVCPSGREILNAVETENHWTPAHYAARYNMLNALDFIAGSASDLEKALRAVDRHGQTPEDLARKHLERHLHHIFGNPSE